MAIKLPSNYTLRSNAFLDSRQGPHVKSDLKGWDFSENPIPLGFEVFVLEESNGQVIEENWYTYNTVWNEETGYFKLRAIQENISPDQTTTPTPPDSGEGGEEGDQETSTTPAPVIPDPVVLPEGLLIIGNEIGEVD